MNKKFIIGNTKGAILPSVSIALVYRALYLWLNGGLFLLSPLEVHAEVRTQASHQGIAGDRRYLNTYHPAILNYLGMGNWR